MRPSVRLPLNKLGLPQVEATDSLLNGTQDDEIGPVVQVGGLLEVLGDRLAGQEAQEVRPSDITANLPTGATVETLARFTALHPRRIRQRDEALIQVHAPLDVSVHMWETCCIDFSFTKEGAAAAVSGATEHPLHLAGWETITRTALTVHHCIYRLTLHIFAVRRFHEYFYDEFNLDDGIATMSVVVPAMEDAYNDFMLPYLQYLCRMRNPDHLPNPPINHPDHLPNDERLAAPVVDEGLREFNDNRFIRILEATMDMPFLREIEINLDNAATTVPSVDRELLIQLTHCGPSQLRRLTYEVDGILAESLECECGQCYRRQQNS
ncbi:hypothetical protein MTO96_025885 [Rhipicephalus appendiculatus]